MDQFDKSSRIFQTAQKTYSWTSRFIEAAMTFLTVNARPAYVVRNDLHLTDYSMLKFYSDIFKEKYPTNDEIFDMRTLDKKLCFETAKRCNWTKPKKCGKRSHLPCDNFKCKKVACQDHSTRNGSNYFAL